MNSLKLDFFLFPNPNPENIFLVKFLLFTPQGPSSADILSLNVSSDGSLALTADH